MSKKVFNEGGFTFNSVSYAVTALNIDQTMNLLDVTDSSTLSTSKEFRADRIEVDFTVDIWKDVASDNISIGDIETAELDFDGFQYSGSAIITSVSDIANIDDAIKQSISGKFTGILTETKET